MPTAVRICVCGDESTGKSSLIASLVKDQFMTNKIQPVLPQISIPPKHRNARERHYDNC
ncbi:uncharacterized protein TrAtP1_008747 [Trichoderma atroviride]|uniref:uncharacterized protein n=1 Tax=Hypocrea atroviridis TaxID=63577 RepID=UPI00332071D1|nr:hypothetical protein TrAtP1_008747 [Trichoderma atroviride]